jgi:hypothetical protein
MVSIAKTIRGADGNNEEAVLRLAKGYIYALLNAIRPTGKVKCDQNERGSDGQPSQANFSEDRLARGNAQG